MNNGIGITFGFVIGGLLLVSVISMNQNVNENAGRTVLDISAKLKATTINQIMRRDFVRMGNGMANPGDNPIKVATQNKIIFWADIDDDPATGASKISWEFDHSDYTATANPQDFKLVRTITSGSAPPQTSTFSVVNPDDTDDSYKPGFFYNSPVLSKIRSITVHFATQPNEAYADSKYPTSLMNRTFTPAHLGMKNMKWN